MQEEQQQRIYINRTKPYVTYVLMGLNIAVFAVEMLLRLTGMDQTHMLMAMGAKVNLMISFGQYWRLLTCCFLHAGVEHILFNLIALYFWGPHIEVLLGRVKYLIVYLAAGLYGSLLSYVCSDSLSVGASGAIFGLFGALLYFRTRHKQVFDRIFGMQVLIIIGLNLVNGFLNTGIDNFGHIGGLIGGFCTAYCTGLYREKPNGKQIAAIVGVAAVAVGLFLFGMARDVTAYGYPLFTFMPVKFS